MGSVGDPYDNALAGKINGLYEAEPMRRRAPWMDRGADEPATLGRVAWFDRHRLLEPVGPVPPAGEGALLAPNSRARPCRPDSRRQAFAKAGGVPARPGPPSCHSPRSMCNRYRSPPPDVLFEYFGVAAPAAGYPDRDIFPRAPGPFVRRARESAGFERELVVGQWGLVPWFAKTAALKYSTNNARSEELASKASYKQPWARGQRCVIPAEHFDEPCWETGRNVWQRFRRADGCPWALAGLWSTWTDKDTGEVVESYTMCTINADGHPLMSRMHKPDPKLPADRQDKRSVVPIELADIDVWLHGTPAQARQLLELAPADVFEMSPA